MLALHRSSPALGPFLVSTRDACSLPSFCLPARPHLTSPRFLCLLPGACLCVSPSGRSRHASCPHCPSAGCVLLCRSFVSRSLSPFLMSPPCSPRLLCAAGWPAPASRLPAGRHRPAPGRHLGGGHCCASGQWQRSSSSWAQTTCGGTRGLKSVLTVLPSRRSLPFRKEWPWDRVAEDRKGCRKWRPH